MAYLKLYIAVLAGLAALLLLSLGSGLWGCPADYASWNYRLFQGVCHQIPERSFEIGGVPMAVNSRCFGVFTGLLLFWVLIPAIGRSLSGRRWPFLFLFFAVALQLADFGASRLSVWNSSNFSRFFSGMMLGAATVIVLAESFVRNDEGRSQDQRERGSEDE